MKALIEALDNLLAKLVEMRQGYREYAKKSRKIWGVK
jgi:hypothetical protein